MIPCPDEEVLLQYVNDELVGKDDEDVEDHLGNCAACRSKLDELQASPRTVTNPGPGPQENQDAETTKPSSSQWSVPKLNIPGYKEEAELGRGGLGVVYLANDTELNRKVAIKVLLPSSLEEGKRDKNCRLFQSEAIAVSRLDHPNIVKLYRYGEHEGQLFHVLEYVQGTTLAQQLDRRPQDPAASARLLEKLARAMHHAHGLGVVHRDLKPANILIRTPVHRWKSSGDALDHCVAKIADFGMANFFHENLSRSSAGAFGGGTPCYMAPEQFLEKKPYPAVDIYSLGVIFYEMLTGNRPFDASNLPELYELVRHQQPVPPRQSRSSIPRDLEVICLKCLEKDPAHRYTTALDLAEDLERHLQGKPIQARPAGVLEKAWRWGKRNPAIAALGTVAAIALVAVGFNGWLLHVDTQRIASLRDQGEDSFALAQDAFHRNHWNRAAEQLEKTLGIVREEPSLLPLRSKAAELLRQTQQWNQFHKLRNDISVASVHLARDERQGHLAKVRSSAREALDAFQIDPKQVNLDFLKSSSFQADQQKAIQRDCYEVMILLADATAEPAAGEDADSQRQEALHLLQEAAKLHSPSWALQQRKLAWSQPNADPAAIRFASSSGEDERLDSLDHFLMGHALYRQKQWPAAIRHLESVLREKPNDFRAQFFLGSAHLNGDRPDEAQTYLSACLSLEPEHVMGHLLRGAAHAKRALKVQAGPKGPQRSREARELFDLAEADFQSARRLQAKQGASQDSDYIWLMNHGVLELQRGRPDLAMTDFLAAAKIHPERYQAFGNLAYVFESQHRLDKAVEQIDQALKLAPKEAHLYRHRAMLLTKMGPTQRTRAEEDLRQAVALQDSPSKDLAGDLKELGLLAMQSRNWDLALERFEASIATGSDVVLPHYHSAEVWMRRANESKDPATKRDCLKRSLASLNEYLQRVEPQLGRYFLEKQPILQAYKTRAGLHAALNHIPSAIADCDRAIYLTETAALTKDPSLYVVRGRYHLILDSIPLALRDFDKALASDPTLAEARVSRGLCLARMRQFSEGVQEASEALPEAKKDPRILYLVARTFAVAGEMAEVELRQRKDLPPQLPAQFRRSAQEYLQQTMAMLPTDEERARFWKESVESDRYFRNLTPERSGR